MEKVMKRTLVSQNDLLNWLNLKLSEHDWCIDCRFTAVQKLREEDEKGCNWSGANLKCSGVPAEICQPIVQQIITEAEDKFNLI